jgi:hypothetical protein
MSNNEEWGFGFNDNTFLGIETEKKTKKNNKKTKKNNSSCTWGRHKDSCDYVDRTRVENKLKSIGLKYPWGKSSKWKPDRLNHLLESDVENTLILGENKKEKFDPKKHDTMWLIGSVLLPERIDKKFGPEGFYYKISKYLKYLGLFRSPDGRRELEVFYPLIDVDSDDFKLFLSDSNPPKEEAEKSRVHKAVDILRRGQLPFNELVTYFITGEKGTEKARSKICETYYMKIALFAFETKVPLWSKREGPLYSEGMTLSESQIKSEIQSCANTVEWDKEHAKKVVETVEFKITDERAGYGNDIPIKDIANQIIECGKGTIKRRFLIFDIFLAFQGGEGMHAGGHANYLIFDLKNGRATRIEPHGNIKTFYSQHFLDCFINKVFILEINKILKKNGIDILDYTNDDVDPNGKPCVNRNRFRKMEEAARKVLPSPQSFGERGAEILYGTCATWSFYIMIMYVLYPKLRISSLHELTAENDPGSRLIKFLYRIYNFFHKNIPKYKEELKNSLITAEKEFSNTGDEDGDIEDTRHSRNYLSAHKARTLKDDNIIYTYNPKDMCDINHPKFNCSGDSNIYKFNLRDGYLLKLKTGSKEIAFKPRTMVKKPEKKTIRDSAKEYISTSSVHTQGNKEGEKLGSASEQLGWDPKTDSSFDFKDFGEDEWLGGGMTTDQACQNLTSDISKCNIATYNNLSDKIPGYSKPSDKSLFSVACNFNNNKCGSIPEKNSNSYFRNFYDLEFDGEKPPEKSGYYLSWKKDGEDTILRTAYMGTVAYFHDKIRVYYYVDQGRFRKDVNYPGFPRFGKGKKITSFVLEKKSGYNLVLAETEPNKIYNRWAILLDKPVPFTSDSVDISLMEIPFERDNIRPFNRLNNGDNDNYNV